MLGKPFPEITISNFKQIVQFFCPFFPTNMNFKNKRKRKKTIKKRRKKETCISYNYCSTKYLYNFPELTITKNVSFVIFLGVLSVITWFWNRKPG